MEIDPNVEIMRLIDERDEWEGRVNCLIDFLERLHGQDFGEWTSLNDPFENAVEFLGDEIASTAKPA